MLSNEKVSNVLVDRKKELVTTWLSDKKSSTKDVDEGTDELADMPLMKKKSSTKDVDKGTDELEDMTQAVVTIYMKWLDHFQGQYKASKVWFKLEKQHFYKAFRFL